ncbi:MAG: YbhB/YbcL family Raf kinase inhibitor-like protein [Myxococcales bacterium]|nr:YbhB/YbcL family Raf kinase inhibitor-like protein [Myxococcales bacterium]
MVQQILAWLAAGVVTVAQLQAWWAAHQPATFELTSPDMIAHAGQPCLQQLPPEAMCLRDGGDNLNPELVWSGVPAGTVQLALLMDDMDYAPQGNPYDHWTVVGLDPTTTGIERGASGTQPTGSLPAGSAEVAPYLGSCSAGLNTYRWRLIALDTAVPQLPQSQTQFETWAQGHTLATAEMCHCPEGGCHPY